MMRSTAGQFYQRYFYATRHVSWLARQMAGMRFKMLEDLMQWEVTRSTSEH